MIQNKKIVMCGVQQSGIEVLRDLHKNGIKISYVVSINSSQALKENVSGYASYEDIARELKIPIYLAEKYSLKGDKDIAFFKEQGFDLLVQGGWQRLFPTEILTTLHIGAIGGHGSSEFLPKGRGRSPVNWSIIEGKKRFIIQYFLIKPGVDDGDIFHYKVFDINEWDTCYSIYLKLTIISKRMMLEWIPRLLNGNYELLPQQGEPSYYPKRNPEDGIIDWKKNIFEIYNFVRALTKPYPGAFAYMDKNILKIWVAFPFDTQISYPKAQKGEIVELFEDGNFIINCNSGLLLVTQYECTEKLQIGKILRSSPFKI